MTNAHKCLLTAECTLAGGSRCNDFCAPYIAMGGRIKSAGLPARYRLTTLKDASPRADQADIYAKLDAYARTFKRQFDDEQPDIKSLYLWSESPGTGKTTTAAALLNEWLRVAYLGAVKRGKQPSIRPAYFLDINEWQSAYNLATMTKDEAALAEMKRIILRAATADFLVIDDVGVRSATEAFAGYVHAIVNTRVSENKPTIYTSNLPIDEMANVFSPRLYDRMRDQAAVFHFNGKSHRGRK